MIEIYNKHKDEDGFLYLQYSDQESLWFLSLNQLIYFTCKRIMIYTIIQFKP